MFHLDMTDDFVYGLSCKIDGIEKPTFFFRLAEDRNLGMSENQVSHIFP